MMYGHEYIENISDIKWVIDNDAEARFLYEVAGKLRVVKSLLRNFKNLSSRDESLSVEFSSPGRLAAYRARLAPTREPTVIPRAMAMPVRSVDRSRAGGSLLPRMPLPPHLRRLP